MNLNNKSPESTFIYKIIWLWCFVEYNTNILVKFFFVPKTRITPVPIASIRGIKWMKVIDSPWVGHESIEVNSQRKLGPDSSWVD